MTIQPLFDRVLIKRKEQSRTTASGLILPGADQDKLNQGIVVAVGAGVSDENGNTANLEVSTGDLVVFGKYAGNTINEDGEELLILKEKEILGILSA